jgi:SAM-dependent methyltransferase
MQSPFPSLSTLEECSSCHLLFRTDRYELSNPNIAYEEQPDSVARLLSQEEKRGPYYDKWIDWIEDKVAAPGPLLEIGVGAGGLLKRLIGRGWEVEGIESSEALCETARKNVGSQTVIHNLRLEEAGAALSRRPYRAVLAIDVLEHLPDLFLMPRLAREWLQPGGVLILQTPNSEALRRFLEKENWEQLAPGEHFVIHSKNSLRLLLEKSGYTEIEVRTRSGTGVDPVLRRIMMAPMGRILNLLGAGNALLAVAKKN